MTTIGLCTHFSETDDWAFEYAFGLAKSNDWQLNICHWLNSPYRIRRDIVQTDLFKEGENGAITPHRLASLELQLREYYEPKLGNFTQAAFKLCEGLYQVELVRCFRKHLLDLVVMGYQFDEVESLGHENLEAFAARLAYPLIIVGADGPDSYMLNRKAVDFLGAGSLPAGQVLILEPQIAGRG